MFEIVFIISFIYSLSLLANYDVITNLKKTERFFIGFFTAAGVLYFISLFSLSVIEGVSVAKLSFGLEFFSKMLGSAVAGSLVFLVLMGSWYLEPIKLILSDEPMDYINKYTREPFLCGWIHTLHLVFLLSGIMTIFN